VSTKKKQASAGQFVIVRALADEPVRLRLVGLRGKVIDAIGTDETCPMPFHLTRTYRFDHDLFGKMRSAFDTEDRDTLNSLWNVAAPFAPAK
jgi:hypothetical protein